MMQNAIFIRKEDQLNSKFKCVLLTSLVFVWMRGYSVVFRSKTKAKNSKGCRRRRGRVSKHWKLDFYILCALGPCVPDLVEYCNQINNNNLNTSVM